MNKFFLKLFIICRCFTVCENDLSLYGHLLCYKRLQVSGNTCICVFINLNTFTKNPFHDIFEYPPVKSISLTIKPRKLFVCGFTLIYTPSVPGMITQVQD